MKANWDISIAKCQEALDHLDGKIKDGIQDGFYTIPHGYAMYCRDVENIIRNYSEMTEIGVAVCIPFLALLWHSTCNII